jgi:hypothetical protein
LAVEAEEWGLLVPVRVAEGGLDREAARDAEVGGGDVGEGDEKGGSLLSRVADRLGVQPPHFRDDGRIGDGAAIVSVDLLGSGRG